jgi:hypothetical protein
MTGPGPRDGLGDGDGVAGAEVGVADGTAVGFSVLLIGTVGGLTPHAAVTSSTHSAATIAMTVRRRVSFPRRLISSL